MLIDEGLDAKRTKIFKVIYGDDYRENTTEVVKSDFYHRIFNLIKVDRLLIQSEEEIAGPFANRLRPLLESDAKLDELTAADLRAIFKVCNMNLTSD